MRRNNRRGGLEEEYFLELLRGIVPGINMTTNSGATFGNGDLGSPGLLVDVKSTEGKGFSAIKQEDWDKIKRQAGELGKDFVVPIRNANGDVAFIFPKELGLVALRLLYKPKPKPKSTDDLRELA